MKTHQLTALIFLSLVASLSLSCSKIEFKKIDSPAYLRVFNNLKFKLTVENKEESLSALTMLINPVFDAQGLPISAQTVGDFLVTREAYAPPYPSHIGNSIDVFNPEYPGKEKVLAAPILNGFDLSSWAQVPSGQQRVLFYYRPKSEVPFFKLEARFKSKPMIDTTLNLDAHEVYTMHVLQKDFVTKENGLMLRKEVFQKLPLSDSLVYVNFYNMSAKGFADADGAYKPTQNTEIYGGIKDEMKVYYTLWDNPALPSNDRVYITTMKRNTELADVTPYAHFPLYPNPQSKTFESTTFETFYFLAPGYNIAAPPPAPDGAIYNGLYAYLICYLNGKVNPFIGGSSGPLLPNLIVTTHSGTYNPRSFATVNSIEVVNGDAYLTTVQRVYAPPVY